ncbi:MAG TPA: tetratricopeptide repeat protein, partial [Candidatus Acidoferrum sp.]|nr:tetratricopeptide repeat protein [Candidatus Acidoferrum sp.]
MRRLSTLFLLCLAPVPAFAQFMRGKVVMPDGSAPPQKALIERVCPSAKPVQEAVANKVGEFVWRINNDTTSYKLLTIGNNVPLRCSLRARINGFESNEVDIGDPVVLNNPELPRLILHPAGDAPVPELPKLSRVAIKAWDLGTKALTTQQWPDAERYLRAVTQAAPGFGLAWSGLGYALQSQQKPVEARDAYRRAIAADPASLLSRVQLARMEVAAKLWTEASATATALIAADREHRYPEAFLHHGLARYALKDHDGARTSLTEAIRLDAKHEMPQAEYLLGAALNAKGDRTGAVEHLRRYLEAAPEAPNAAFVRDQIARLTKPAAIAAPEPAMPVPDEILPAETEPTIVATGEARVPGGRKALAVIARLARVPEPAAFFPEYCRVVAEETSPLSEHHTPGYSAALEAFLESASELADLGERRGDRTRVVLSLSADALPRTERALALLGWKVVRGEGTAAVEPGDRAVDAPRHAVARALGIDESAMRDALAGGGSFSFDVISENVPLTGGSAWGVLLQGFPTLPGGVAQGFVRQPRLARACAGLGRLEPATAIALARSIGLRTLLNLYADSLWQNSDSFRAAGGRVAVPGGAAAEEIWAKLAGATPREPAKFFEALLKADKGRLAPFYAAVARGDAAHQAWFTRDAARAQRFYAWFRDAPRPIAPWRSLLFQDLPLDAAGSVRYPGGRPAWTKAASDDDGIAPITRIGNLRMIRSADAVDLEALLAVARLERERGRPFDAESAGLLWRHFAEWRELFPYFAQLPAMGGGEFQAL